MKFPFYKKLPKGIYRVAPLGRLNVAESISTPIAAAELRNFKELGKGKPVRETLYFHYARVIELLYAAERAKELLEDDDIVSKDTRIRVDRRAGEGMESSMPRGVL